MALRLRRSRTLKDVQISTLVPSSTTWCDGEVVRRADRVADHEGIDPFLPHGHLRPHRGNRYLPPDEEGSGSRITSDSSTWPRSAVGTSGFSANPERNSTHWIPADSSSTVTRASSETRGARSVVTFYTKRC